MEMKQINETTLKITVSMEDLEIYGMELKDFLVPQEKTEEFFYTILDELDLPENFKHSGMLSFRVTPRKDRIDVFVTKSELKEDLNLEDLADLNDLSQMSPDEFFKSIENSMLKKGDKQAHKFLKEMEEMVDGVMTSEQDQLTSAEQAELEEEEEQDAYVHYVFRFPDFDQVMEFVEALEIEVEVSELYKDDKEYYMTILLALENKPAYYANLMYARLFEHAQASLKTRAYLQEHGKALLTYGAVEELRKIGGR
ncbi:adaptor protein MecA [Streptococcus cuniculipharyngis]|uniref:Adapter protein MecA n=1 Tax=Streptococcus cuniculipharyngis TaxID=1562651 RepID=A0A5C5SAX5_9STRE|nr:adaptor protein MecA [Streptococcus cuniculipharyngis]TWS97436.1 adaptor protein MecA [Streptococcus cuniculipharyngis]